MIALLLTELIFAQAYLGIHAYANEVQTHLDSTNVLSDLRSSTVRSKGELQRYPFNYVLSCVRENKTQEQIEKEERIAQLLKEGYSLDIIADLFVLTFEELEKYKELRSKYEHWEALRLVKFTPEEFERYQEFKDKYGHNEAFKLAKFTPEELKKYKEFEEKFGDKSFAY